MTPKQKAEETLSGILSPEYPKDGYTYRTLVNAFAEALQEQLYIQERADRRLEQALTEARVEELERLFKVAWIDDCIIKRIAALKAGKGGE
jgi:hypothetical protein